MPAGVLAPFAASPTASMTVPIAGHEMLAPGELARARGQLGFAADPRDERLPSALGASPAGARVLVFGSLYLAGEVLAANDQLPD